MSLQMRLHQSNQSRLLRRDGVGQCKFCGSPIEWFDQYDARRVPLTPEFPARRVPARYRWHLSGGVAYPGSDRFSDYCRVPHPAVCPAAERESLPRQLEEVRRLLAVRMRERIEQGLFTPYAEEPSEGQAYEPDLGGQRAGDRHVLNYHGDLRLAPCAIDEVQCVAADEEGERCPNPVFVLAEGHWEQVGIPYAPGRSGQMILTGSGRMYVWSVTEYAQLLRWCRQHCPDHHEFQGTADFTSSEWVTFQTIRHADFIITRKPEGYEAAPTQEEITIHDGPRKRTVCAAAECLNATVAAVAEGWLCWRCEQLQRRRRRAHRKYIAV